jgi:glycosyltransferase involved in cell wall biosynthesis
MRIGIDATAAGIAGSARTGVYQYTYQLIRAIAGESPQSEFRLMFALPRRKHTASIQAFARALDLPNVVLRRCLVPSRYLMRWRIPADLFTGPIDVFHAPAHIGFAVRRCPLVVTVHDLAYLRELRGAATPDGLDATAAANWRDRRRFFSELARNMTRSLDDARCVIAVSQHTANDLVETLGVDRSKVQVVHPGLRSGIHRIDAASRQPTLDRHGIDSGYFLYVGSLDPNKNIQTLIEGYARYRQLRGSLLLVIAGHSHFYGDVLRLLCQRLGIERHVRFLGFVDDSDLPALYSGARAVIMPSPLEGFGFPVIESMACGTPVIGANAGALPEVIGSAGMLVTHDRARSFAEAMRTIEGDAKLHARLVEGGTTRAADFTWRRAAQQTLAVYTKVARGAVLRTESNAELGSRV